MSGKLPSWFNFAPGTRRELWAALAPFLLFGALTILLAVFHSQGLALDWLGTAVSLLTVAIVVGLSLIGISKGMPRWFMPYLGLPLPIISVLVFNRWLDDWNGFRFYRLQERSWFLREFVYQGLLWLGLAGSVLLLVVLVRSLANFHPVFKRLKNDWTLLCFVVYGAAPLVLVLTFDEYRYEEPYLFVAFVILALFAWMYLRTKSPLQKFLALYMGVGLSMSIAAVGKLFIVPLQHWPVTFDTALSITESLSTVVMWLWLALIMLIPPLIHLMLPSESPQT